MLSEGLWWGGTCKRSSSEGSEQGAAAGCGLHCFRSVITRKGAYSSHPNAQGIQEAASNSAVDHRRHADISCLTVPLLYVLFEPP
jgi:hypothetical protein